ncbi:MAG: OsmC family protein [Actinomycetota bacterium]
MEVTAYWEGGYRCRMPVRVFEVQADEPPDCGGADAGPTPTELFLSSLASCFAMAVAHAARKRGVELADLAVRVRGHYQGLRFNSIVVEVLSSHPREELEALVQRARSYCYVSNTLRNEVRLDFVVSDDQLSHLPPPSPGR